MRFNMRTLVSIQKIEELRSIDGADFIEKARILGWTCIVKKGEFKVGDLCVYHEIDSICPEHPVYSFLKKPRIKTMKMRGTISQGLALPVSILTQFKEDINLNSLEIDQDVTDILGVTKYELPEYYARKSTVTNPRPFFVPKTDETRLQSILGVLDEIEGVKCYATVKLDGTSASYSYKGGEFYVCSRGRLIPEEDSEGCHWWAIAKKYDLEKKLARTERRFYPLVIQGEICGPKIQSNKLGLDDFEFFLFDAMPADSQDYMGLASLKAVAHNFGLKMAPLLKTFVPTKENNTLESYLKLAEGKYEGTKNEREGIVIRPVKPMPSSMLKSQRLSFKVVSNRFLLKN
jgi:RNA ligase (TIGR02306 family)